MLVLSRKPGERVLLDATREQLENLILKLDETEDRLRKAYEDGELEKDEFNRLWNSIRLELAVTCVRIGPNAVKLGFDAPKEFNIVREEIS